MAKQQTGAARAARFRARQHAKGLRRVALWLLDTRDPAFRARLVKECRQLSVLTSDEQEIAEISAALLAEAPE